MSCKKFTQDANAWNYSVKTTRQAFWKMVERGEEADVFDLVFSELTVEQCKSINLLMQKFGKKSFYRSMTNDRSRKTRKVRSPRTQGS